MRLVVAPAAVPLGPFHPTMQLDIRDISGRIRKSERHLLGLINGVLNYAHVEAGAVRYDPGGRIELRWVVSRDTQSALVHLKVADTGIGIAPHQLTRVFEPFVQVDSQFRARGKAPA